MFLQRFNIQENLAPLVSKGSSNCVVLHTIFVGAMPRFEIPSPNIGAIDQRTISPPREFTRALPPFIRNSISVLVVQMEFFLNNLDCYFTFVFEPGIHSC